MRSKEDVHSKIQRYMECYAEMEDLKQRNDSFNGRKIMPKQGSNNNN
jgi:hypothetical protein